MGGVMRSAMAVTLVICLIMVIGARAIGTQSESITSIDYHGYAGEMYLLYVRDMSRNFRLWLAGTRCFKPLPGWIYAEFYQTRYAGYVDPTGHTSRHDVYHNAEFMAPLRCP